MQKKIETLFARQGDVILMRIENFDDAVKGVDQAPLTPAGELVFALGERTGHRHRFGGLKRGDRAFRRGNLETGAEHFVSLRGSRTLLHEEHAPIDVPPGEYRFFVQRQYEAGQIRNVQD